MSAQAPRRAHTATTKVRGFCGCAGTELHATSAVAFLPRHPSPRSGSPLAELDGPPHAIQTVLPWQPCLVERPNRRPEKQDALERGNASACLLQCSYWALQGEARRIKRVSAGRGGRLVSKRDPFSARCQQLGLARGLRNNPPRARLIRPQSRLMTATSWRAPDATAWVLVQARSRVLGSVAGAVPDWLLGDSSMDRCNRDGPGAKP
jgi:hypothetical protein